MVGIHGKVFCLLKRGEDGFQVLVFDVCGIDLDWSL